MKDLEEFPLQVEALPSMRSLSVSYYDSHALPDPLLMFLGLKKLFLGKSEITMLPDSLGQLSSLHELILHS